MSHPLDPPVTLRNVTDVSRNGTHKHIRNGGGRPKIDWAAARSYYALHLDAGFTDVARRFGVSSQVVGRHARAEGWDAYRADVQAEVAERRRDADIRALEQRQADTIRVAERLRAVALAVDTPIDMELAVRMLPAYAKLEQLFAGEATDRISIPQTRDFMLAFAKGVEALAGRIVVAHVANGKAKLILAEFQAGLGDVIEEAAGGLPELEAAAA